MDRKNLSLSLVKRKLDKISKRTISMSGEDYNKLKQSLRNPKPPIKICNRKNNSKKNSPMACRRRIIFTPKQNCHDILPMELSPWKKDNSHTMIAGSPHSFPFSPPNEPINHSSTSRIDDYHLMKFTDSVSPIISSCAKEKSPLANNENEESGENQTQNLIKPGGKIKKKKFSFHDWAKIKPGREVLKNKKLCAVKTKQSKIDSYFLVLGH